MALVRVVTVRCAPGLADCLPTAVICPWPAAVPPEAAWAADGPALPWQVGGAAGAAAAAAATAAADGTTASRPLTTTADPP